MTDQAVPFYHAPIMAGEVLSLLEPSRGGIFVDGTLGGGGHAQRVLEVLPAGGRLYGIDRDWEPHCGLLPSEKDLPLSTGISLK